MSGIGMTNLRFKGTFCIKKNEQTENQGKSILEQVEDVLKGEPLNLRKSGVENLRLSSDNKYHYAVLHYSQDNVCYQVHDSYDDRVKQRLKDEGLDSFVKWS